MIGRADCSSRRLNRDDVGQAGSHGNVVLPVEFFRVDVDNQKTHFIRYRANTLNYLQPLAFQFFSDWF